MADNRPHASLVVAGVPFATVKGVREALQAIYPTLAQESFANQTVSFRARGGFTDADLATAQQALAAFSGVSVSFEGKLITRESLDNPPSAGAARLMKERALKVSGVVDPNAEPENSPPPPFRSGIPGDYHEDKVITPAPKPEGPTRAAAEQLGPPKPPSKGGPEVPMAAQEGAGGEMTFEIGVWDGNNGFDKAFDDKKSKIELAPARRSHFDKQGQQVPGAGAGLTVTQRANLTRLNVPGGRAIYQHMGLAEELLEWVGAFVGFDLDGEDAGGAAIHDPESNGGLGKRTNSAWEEGFHAQNSLKGHSARGRELMLKLEWASDGPSTDSQGIWFSKNKGVQIHYHGYIKDISFAFAHAQRLYYRVTFAVANREDLEGAIEKSPLKDIMPPPFLTGGVNGGGAATNPGNGQPAGGSTVEPVQPATVTKENHEKFLKLLEELWLEAAPVTEWNRIGIKNRYERLLHYARTNGYYRTRAATAPEIEAQKRTKVESRLDQILNNIEGQQVAENTGVGGFFTEAAKNVFWVNDAEAQQIEELKRKNQKAFDEDGYKQLGI